jgi:hypothetical protein
MKYKAKGYWDNQKNLVLEIETMKCKGKYPTQTEIANQLGGGAVKAVQKLGGISGVVELLGGTIDRPRGHWQYWDNLKNELSGYTVMPSMKRLRREVGRSAENAIKKFGGIEEVSGRLGLEIVNKPKGYWSVREKLETEIRSLIIAENFPSLRMILDNLGSGAAKAIAHLGGIKKLSVEMGYPHRYSYLTSDGHFVLSSYELVVDEFLFARKIPHEVGCRISNESKFRCDFKINDFFIEVWGFESDRKSKIRNTYNEKRKIKEQFYQEKQLNLVSLEHKLFQAPLTQVYKNLEFVLEPILGKC